MATRTRPPRSAARHYAASALLAQRAVREARTARVRGVAAVVAAVTTHQVAQAQMSEQAVAEMLTEQDIDLEAQAVLNALAFVTPADLVGEAVASVEEAGGEDWRFDRLVASLVADAGRAAESVAITARPGVGWVRYLRPPSCSRCAVLAGRFYRWSDGFRRHPGCDCVHLASTEAAAEGLVTDPVELVEQGLVSGLSKADRRAILDGADVSQVVNTRTAMTASAPASRLRPMSIYDAATDQADAIRLLRLYGYIT